MAPTPSDLLLTKLHIPRVRSPLVHRTRLIELLRAGLERRLTLVSAPAGFGKTTLLAEWTLQSPHCVTWLSLEEGDNDPTRFWTYFTAALQRLQPDIGAYALSLLHSAQPAPMRSVITALVNEIDAFPDSFSLVLDDCHVIEAEPIYEALDFLLEHLPPRMHLVIATRTDPAISLARLRMRNQMVELRAADLRFDNPETGAFLKEVMGFQLPAADVSALETHTEGWIAGLHLAALRLASPETAGDDRSSFIRDFTGSNVYILDYLVQEVLQRQSEDVQTFLKRTSILDRLNGPLCDSLAEQEDEKVSGTGQAMLERLQRANLFISPLDEERRWYRYHHLFAEVLRARLQVEEPDLLPALHRRAGAWFEREGRNAEAIEHALAGTDFDRAGRLIEQLAPPTVVGGQVQTALGWLNALPPEAVCERPTLGVIHAAALMFTQDLAGAAAKLSHTERCMEANAGRSAEETRAIRGRIAMTQATLVRVSGDLAGCVAYACEALALLPETETFWRASPLVHAASAYYLSRDVTDGSARSPGLAHAGEWSVTLIEPLSSRELDVLVLLADTLSNAEIAHKLYVSPETVKVHLKHIYGKLAVNSRNQAVARARDLSLL